MKSNTSKVDGFGTVVCRLRARTPDAGRPTPGLRSDFVPSDTRGFTLLELMTVMFIMFILMGMATLSLRGLVRGAGLSGAVSITRASITQARQNAIMQGRPTAVVVTRNSMLQVVQYDQVDGIAGGQLEVVQGLPWTESYLRGGLLYNLENGYSQRVSGNSQNTMAFTMEGGATGGNWPTGAGVGFASGQERSLPEGFIFRNIPAGQERIILFERTGMPTATHSLTLEEEFGGSRSVGITVDFAGRVTVEE